MFGIGIIRIIISNQQSPTLLRFKAESKSPRQRETTTRVFCSYRHITPKLYIIIYIHRTAINPTFFKSQNPNSIWFLFSAIHSSPGSCFFFFPFILYICNPILISFPILLFLVYIDLPVRVDQKPTKLYIQEKFMIFFLLFYTNSTNSNKHKYMRKILS